ncbi:hypothetical protein ACW9I5_34615, partial [Pseudomonas azotoformans]
MPTTPCLRITTADAPLLHSYSPRRIVLIIIGLPVVNRSLLTFTLSTLTGAHFPVRDCASPFSLETGEPPWPTPTNPKKRPL